MPDRGHHFLKEPEHIRAEDLFPDWGTDVDRRIAASEARIKFWVLGGVITNLVVAIGAAIPLVFFFGQISRDIAQTVVAQQASVISAEETVKWRQERMVWEARVESILESKGITMQRPEKHPLPQATP